MAKKFNYIPWIIGGAAAWFLLRKPTTIQGIGAIQKITEIHIHGKRWFQKSYGNTYHTVSLSIYGKGSSPIFTEKSPIKYGYGSQYEQTAIDILQDNGFIKDYDMTNEPFWKYCERKGINLISNATDVNKKSQL